MEHIKRIKREIVYEGTIVDFCQDTMELPDGTLQKWDLVHHRKGAAAVVAVDNDGKLVMVKQYRPALDRETLEIPAGARDSVNEDTKITALRELEEETGFKANKCELFFKVKSTVAFCDEFVDVYLATDLVETRQNLDPEEFIDVYHCDIEELVQKVFSCEIEDSKTVAAIMAYAVKVKK